MKKAEMKTTIINKTIEARKEVDLFEYLKGSENSKLYDDALTKFCTLYELCCDLDIDNEYIENMCKVRLQELRELRANKSE